MMKRNYLADLDNEIERGLAQELSSPLLREWAKSYLEPKIAAVENRSVTVPAPLKDENLSDLEESTSVIEAIHDDLEDTQEGSRTDELVSGLMGLASLAVSANNEKAAYLIELAVAQITEEQE
jgi:hypothetical protein